MSVSVEALGLEKVGIREAGQIYRNLNHEELFEHEVRKEDGTVTANGTMAVDTGKFTGRSPKDKYFVEEESSKDNLWWGPVNEKIDTDVFNQLLEKVQGHLNGKDLYVTDAYCGANEDTRMKLRVVSEIAWQSHFIRNMFIRPTEDELEGFEQDFTILVATEITDEEWKAHGLNSEVFVAFDLGRKLAIIGGTKYGGEMKKGMFSVMNYFLPLQGIAAMHCSANMNENGDTALFFGLSGTGKTTLSTDPDRALIGDDEHGWDEDGIFNFEGGCYAKCIDLDPKTEPDIYNAIRRDALLENVVIDPETKEVVYSDASKTQNTRVSYPIYHIDNIVKPVSKGGHPNNIIFLTYDAFGVLPPVSRLDKGMAMYHYLSGYTSKVAGTERGIDEPQATFSACFGSPFLTLHPTDYAKILGRKIDEHGSKAWLVNTGFTGGAYGTGHRMDLPTTRKLITGILDGSLDKANYTPHPIFLVEVPDQLEGVDPKILDPRETWEDKAAYDDNARNLAAMFIKNFEQYLLDGDDFDFTAHGPKLDQA
ncbi:MAG: phosphoenolpyruvate carboxykinase (ATP) [Candidatus Krumholzibacteria bacterium]|jgi:phosphoenolpyruvate carboxykinase (ATP)|nr:phosphoenolpyruvate carboxykinase (ATP) [Candidatus Krumholzibacteria bacterium]MDP6669839.1 phosphoenolpyruvate carboxykinase (ATP) [Candidatus Krumholzibacteria bacterium]MDP6797744.1 phosphoenolpyruvate carboxykinase (ATP) [Candidatus Krumholzibacteria bacterium]MDP7022238.1 phosphoenolpyruvate carboxykinase (ATP) [Candidatus Krumholzibacteria bacterium]